MPHAVQAQKIIKNYRFLTNTMSTTPQPTATPKDACDKAQKQYERMLQLAHYSPWDAVPLVSPRELDELRLAMNDACATRVRRFHVQF